MMSKAGSPKNRSAPLVFQDTVIAENGARSGRRCCRIPFSGLWRCCPHTEHGLEVLNVNEQQVFRVGYPNTMFRMPDWVSLRLRASSEQQRPHLRNGGADGVPLLAEQVPETNRVRLITELIPRPNFQCAFAYPHWKRFRPAGAGEVSHVCQKDLGHQDR